MMAENRVDNCDKMQIDKEETGIIGLDEVLNGGFPRSSLTLVCGGPGTGKTIIGLEFIIRGAEKNEPGILLTFEEREEDLRNYACKLNWDIEKYEQENLVSLICARIDPEAILSGDFDLKAIFAILEHKVKSLGANRVVIDAPDVFLRLLDNIARERAELHILHDKLRDAGLTTLMTVKGDTDNIFSSHYEFLEYMADCVIQLDQRVYEQVSTRRLRVVKYRGSSCSRNEYPFSITDRGVWIIPVTRANLQHHAFGESISTGISDLDELLDGGYRRNSCTLISGSSGTGKTTFVCSFAVSAAAKGEKILYLDFEESWESLTSCMVSPGIDLKKAKKTGNLYFQSSMPESQGIEEHLIRAFRKIEEFKPKYLIVDAISACRRMGSSHAAFDYLLRLINHCKTIGITSLLTNLTDTKDARDEITGIDLSSVIDTVILLRNLESEGRFTREIGILKSRGRKHSESIHQFKITDAGIQIIGEE